MNLRTLARADLQSAAIDHSATPPLDFLSALALRKSYAHRSSFRSEGRAVSTSSALRSFSVEGLLSLRLLEVMDGLRKVKVDIACLAP